MVKQVKSQLENGATANNVHNEHNMKFRADLCYESIMDIKKVIKCETEFR